MRHASLVFAFAFAAAIAPAQLPAPPVLPTAVDQPVSYWRQVRPLLQARCVGCHQPAKAKGELVLSEHRGLCASATDQPPVVVPGLLSSRLLTAVVPQDGKPPAMPDTGKALGDAEVAMLRRWVQEGATDDSPAASGPVVSMANPPVYAHAPVVTSVDWSPDGALLAVSGYHEVLLHRAADQSIVGRLVGLSERIESVAFSPDGRLLAAVGGSPARMGEVQIWEVNTQQLKLSVPLTFDCLYGASWSPDGRLLAFGAVDKAVRAIDATTGAQVLYQGAHDDWVLDTVFSTDGKHLVSVGRDRAMKLIQVPTQQFLDNITSITPGALRGGLMAVARHPLRDELLVGGADGTPRTYQMFRVQARKIGDDFNLLRAFETMPGRVFAVAYAHDGERIIAGSSSTGTGEVRCYRASDGTLLWRHATRGGIYTVAFRPDGRVVAAGGFDGTVRLFDADRGDAVQQFVSVPLAAIPAEAETAVEDKTQKAKD